MIAKPSTRMTITLQAMTISPKLLVRDWTSKHGHGEDGLDDDAGRHTDADDIGNGAR